MVLKGESERQEPGLRLRGYLASEQASGEVGDMETIDLQALDVSLRNCIAACEACVRACEHVAGLACREVGGERLLRASRDSTDLCALMVRFVARRAALTPELAEVCGKACDSCATECGGFDGDAYQVCADICRTCSEACRALEL